MKAAQITTYGGSEVFKVIENAPKPFVKDGQVLVEVFAAGINPFDWKLRSGMFKEMIPLSFPTILGGDISGVIKAVGKDVSSYRIGDEVYGQASVLSGGSGAFAEFATASVNHIAHKPKNASFDEAASLVLAGVSALQGIEEHCRLQAGQKILIHGGAGGIGSLALQIAKALGAYVVTTVSSNDIEFVKNLGADEVIDYKKEQFEEKSKDFDAVFDTVGGKVTDKSLQVLKKGGFLVSMVGQPDEELAKKQGATAIAQNSVVTTKRLTRLAELVENGKVKPRIDTVFPLERIQDAFKFLEEGSPRGKILLKIKV